LEQLVAEIVSQYVLRLLLREKVNQEEIRVVTYFWVAHKAIYLTSIYDKSEQENFIGQELDELLNDIF
jgi:hypothetical protein